MNRFFSRFQSASFQFALALVINLIAWIIIFVQIRPGREVIPLHYNIFYGPDIFGRGYFLYIIPLVGLCVLTANFFFYRYSLNREKFAARSAVAVALTLQALILVSVFALKQLIVI
ncbi:hypothetical protein KGQ24_00810 [Patescibacteria group bacterium]|nr:hypothetical protein [Patescibacteria group bacterium]